MGALCSGLQSPIPGSIGNLYINGKNYPADSWEWDMSAESIELPSVSAQPFMDRQTGLKRLQFRATGTAMKSFNPFLPLFVGDQPPFLNKYVDVRVTAFVGGGGLAATAAECVNMLISRWTYKDEVDGTTKWELQGEGAFVFQNMNGTIL